MEIIVPQFAYSSPLWYPLLGGGLTPENTPNMAHKLTLKLKSKSLK